MILEKNEGESCEFANVDTPLYSGQAFLSSPAGMVSGRGLVDRDLKIDMLIDGQWAAFVDEDDSVVSCCQLRVTEKVHEQNWIRQTPYDTWPKLQSTLHS